MKTIMVQVTQIVKVTLDDEKFTSEFMAEYRESLYDYTTIEEHAKHLAIQEASGFVGGSKSFIEGYGPQEVMGIKLEMESLKAECFNA